MWAMVDPMAHYRPYCRASRAGTIPLGMGVRLIAVAPGMPRVYHPKGRANGDVAARHEG